MRPVSKGGPYLYTDGQAYGDALAGLAARIGRYCSYCERAVSTGLEVEHIQPKSIHSAQERVWRNFLLGCKNCNATKSDKNPGLHEWLIPDRDNTFAAFLYREDSLIEVRPALTGALDVAANLTLDLMGLNKEVRQTLDDDGNLVALDRRTQRLEAWLMAKRYHGKWQATQLPLLEEAIVDLAQAIGHFSVWMAAFEDVPHIRLRFIAAFAGTETACFDSVTSTPISPHPNLDALPDGSKL